MNVFVVLLLMIGVIFVTISWFKNELHCPPPEVIYRYIPANTIDTQFSKENLPSQVYNDMFNSDNLLPNGMQISYPVSVIGGGGESTPAPVLYHGNSGGDGTPFMSMTSPPSTPQLLTGPIG